MVQAEVLHQHREEVWSLNRPEKYFIKIYIRTCKVCKDFRRWFLYVSLFAGVLKLQRYSNRFPWVRASVSL